MPASLWPRPCLKKLCHDECTSPLENHIEPGGVVCPRHGHRISFEFAPAPEPVVALQPPEEKWRALTLADYEQRLSLTPDQVQRLKPIFAVTGDKLRTLRANTTERVSELIREMNQQTMPALSAEQQTKLKTLLEERRKAKAEGRSQ